MTKIHGDLEKIAQFRHRNGGSYRATEDRWVASATITDRDLYVNGARFPWLIVDDGVRVEWLDADPDGGPRVGRLVVEMFITADDTIVTDLRNPEPQTALADTTTAAP